MGGTDTDPGTTGSGTDAATEPGGGATESGDDTGDDIDVPQECQAPWAKTNTNRFVSGEAWDLDETCVVLASAIVNEALELTLDCPIVAMENDGQQVTLKVENVPLPAAPLVGESLDVLYQIGDFEGFFDYARPELLFLHRDGALLHAVIHGYFLTDTDLALVDTHALPLAAKLVQGLCEHVPTGWDGVGDGTSCQFEARSQMKITGDTELLLAPGQVGEVTAGGHTYTADLRQAVHREACVDMDENIFYTLAIARK